MKTKIWHKLTCQECGRTFKNVRKRACCSDQCNQRRVNKVRYGDVTAMAPTINHIRRAERMGEIYDRDVRGWLHQRIADWYRAKHAQRVAEGGSPVVPILTVLSCHDQGIAAFARPQLVRCAAFVEDAPGAWESEDEE